MNGGANLHTLGVISRVDRSNRQVGTLRRTCLGVEIFGEHVSENEAGTGDGPVGGTRELSVRLSVPEMDSPWCAGKVDKSLGRVDGVVETDVRRLARLR